MDMDETFWTTAQGICLKITDDGSGYRTPPEDAEPRNDPVADIDAMIGSDLLAADRLELPYLPRGWASLLRDVLMAALHLARQHAVSNLVILTGKEKFGELRIAFERTGVGELDAELSDLASWAAEQSRSRCAGTGHPARMTTDGWVIPLSDEIAALKRNDPQAFRRAVAMFPVAELNTPGGHQRAGKHG